MRPDTIDYTQAQLAGRPDSESLNNLKLMESAIQQYDEHEKKDQGSELLSNIGHFALQTLNQAAVLPDMAITFAHSFGKNFREGQDAIEAGTNAIFDAWEAGTKTSGMTWGDEDRPAMKYFKDLVGAGPDEHSGRLEAGALGVDLLAGGALASPEAIPNWIGRHAAGIKGIGRAIKRIAESEGTDILNLTENAFDDLAAMAHGKYADLVTRARAGDEGASRRLLKHMRDPQVAEMIGEGELSATEEVLKKDPARWYRYKSRSLTDAEIKKEVAVHGMRQTGNVGLALRELNGNFARTPFSMRKEIYNINDAQDAEDLMKAYGETAANYIAKAYEKAAAGPEKVANYMEQLLQAQKQTLSVNVGDAVNLPINNAQAFGVNMLLNQIHQNMKASIRMHDEYAFSSGIDMLRFFKLLALRQQVVANVTGRTEGLSKLLNILHTSYDESGDAMRHLRINRAMKRLPAISPTLAKKDAEVALENNAWKWSPEEFAKLKSMAPQIGQMGSGVAGTLVNTLNTAQRAFKTMTPEMHSVVRGIASMRPETMDELPRMLERTDLPGPIKNLFTNAEIPATLKSALAKRMVQAAEQETATAIPRDASWFTDVIYGKYGGKSRKAIMEAVTGDVNRLDNADQMSQYFNAVTRGALDTGRWNDKLYTAYIISILSSPLTHFVNASTNLATTTLAPASDIAASMYRFIQGDYAESGRNLGMAVARTYSWIETGLDLARLTTKYGLEKLPKNFQELEAVKKLHSRAADSLTTMQHGLSDYAGGYEIPPMGMSYGRDAIANLPTTKRGLYHAVQLWHSPTRAMSFADTVFKAVAANSEHRARSWYNAWNQATDVTSARSLYEIISNNRSGLDRARNYLFSEEATFQEELTTELEKMVNSTRAFKGMRWILPFVKTPLNIKRYMSRATGGINLVPVMLDKVLPESRKWAWVKNSKLVQKLSAGGHQAEAALGQLALGNMLLGGLMFANTYGRITGAGGLPIANERNIPYPKYTVFWDDKPFYYGNNEVLKWMVGLPITLKEVYHQVDWESDDMSEAALELAKGMSAVIGDLTTNQTFLSQYTEFLNGIKYATEANNWYYFKRSLTRIAAGTGIPYSGAVAFMTQRIAPAMRETEGLLEDFINRYGMGVNRGDNPYSLDLFGQPRFHDMTGAMYPINLNGADPVTFEIRQVRPRLKMVPITMSANLRPGVQEGRKYTSWERAIMSRLVARGEFFGKPFKDAMSETMQSDLYKASDMAHRRLLLEHLNNSYINAAEQQLLMKERLEPGVLGEQTQ